MDKTKITFVPKSDKVCVKQIVVTLDAETHENTPRKDRIISSVKFIGGCSGQGRAVSRLLKGQTLEKASATLKGITCGMRGTSCSDQLSAVITDWIED